MPGATFTGDTLTVSQSWLNTFQTCPERARLELVGEMPRSSSDATAIGSTVHAYIEQRLAGAEPDEAVLVALKTLEQLVLEEGFRYVKIKTLPTMWGKALHCASMWEKEYWPVIGNVQAIEAMFTLPLSTHRSVNIILEGAIDCIHDQGIVDWKTGAQPYDINEYRRWAIQPTAYWAGARHLGYGELPFTYVVMMRDQPFVQVFGVERSQGHVDWLAEQTHAIVDLILSGLERWPLQSNHWLCSGKWCPVYDNCRGKFLAK